MLVDFDSKIMVALSFNCRTLVVLTLNIPLVLSLVPPLPGHLISRQNSQLCNESDKWSPTPEAWAAASTDQKLAEWWARTSQDGARFDEALGNLLGYASVKCGIGSSSSCPLPSCFGKKQPQLHRRSFADDEQGQKTEVLSPGHILPQSPCRTSIPCSTSCMTDWPLLKPML
jgi:hypothetical protein